MPEAKDEAAPKIDEVVMQEVDKIDQLLDVLHATRDLPSLNSINQAAMTELVRYNTELSEAQAAAQEKFQAEMAEYEAAERAKVKAEGEKKEAEEEAEKERKRRGQVPLPPPPPPTTPSPAPFGERRA